MSYNTNENIILAAPRPVRLAAPTPYPHHFRASVLQKPQTRSAGVRLLSSPAEALESLKLSDESPEDSFKFAEPIDKDLVSPRASPRYVILAHELNLLSRTDLI